MMKQYCLLDKTIKIRKYRLEVYVGTNNIFALGIASCFLSYGGIMLEIMLPFSSIYFRYYTKAKSTLKKK